MYVVEEMLDIRTRGHFLWLLLSEVSDVGKVLEQAGDVVRFVWVRKRAGEFLPGCL